MAFGALIAGGISAAAGAISSHKATSENRKNRRRGQMLLNRFEGRQRQLFDQRLDSLQDSKAAVETGYDNAKSELARADYGVRRRAFDESRKLQGRLASRDVATGSFGGTASANRYRGLSDQTQRKLLDVDATIGRMFSGIAERRGAAMGIAEENIANFFGQQRNAEYETFSDRLALFGAGRAPATAQSFDFSGLGLAFSDLFDKGGEWWKNRDSGGDGFSGGGASGSW